MLGKSEGKRRKGLQRMRWLDSITNSKGCKFEQTPGDNEGQLRRIMKACCSTRGCKESDIT